MTTESTKPVYYNRTYKDVLFDKIFSDKKAILELYNAIAAKKAVEECIEHGILRDILLKEKGVIEDMITVCYDEELHKMREAEYNQELGEARGKELGKQQIVKKMYNAGMSIEQIIDITELTKEELEKLLQP